MHGCMWLHRLIGLCCGNLSRMECVDIMDKTYMPMSMADSSISNANAFPIIFAGGITNLFTYDCIEVEGSTQWLIFEVQHFRQWR